MKVEVNKTFKNVEKIVIEQEEESKEIVLTLTEQEASHLCSVVGNIMGGDSFDPNSIRHTTKNIFQNLDDLVDTPYWASVIATPMRLKPGA